jgi:RNA polymerase subunit RPABC4/transcription elongation factor Spt4
MLESFFFFVGGLQPKITVVDERPRRCPRCGLHQAYLKRVDTYLSLFFIPVLRVKTGEPVLMCDRCAQPLAAEPGPESGSAVEKACRFCNRSYPGDYDFCPRCGRRL